MAAKIGKENEDGSQRYEVGSQKYEVGNINQKLFL